MIVDLSRGALVEALRDASRAVRIAGKEDERRVVALLGAKVNLWHAPSLAEP
jgi:hypothetical protein